MNINQEITVDGCNAEITPTGSILIHGNEQNVDVFITLPELEAIRAAAQAHADAWNEFSNGLDT